MVDDPPVRVDENDRVELGIGLSLLLSCVFLYKTGSIFSIFYCNIVIFNLGKQKA